MYDGAMTNTVIVHLQKTTTLGKCGAKVGMYHLTIDPRQVTCPKCKPAPVAVSSEKPAPDLSVLEGEPMPRPEYRADAGILAEDRNLPRGTWTKGGGWTPVTDDLRAVIDRLLNSW